MSRPFSPRGSSNAGPYVRVNGKIRAREVRVIGAEGKQLGVISLSEALTAARQAGVDLVEIAPNATPPVCRMVDYGKYRYEQAKRDKESKKHQHANRVKEVQLSPKIDPHDLGVKIQHAVNFLCEDMKVKITLKFRGREMAHTEFGFQVIQKFLAQITPFGQPDFQPKLIGRGINVMISPLPRNKRAKNPYESEPPALHQEDSEDDSEDEAEEQNESAPVEVHAASKKGSAQDRSSSFSNAPLEKIEMK